MSRLGHYSLIEEIGHGNFATVYRAVHEALGNQVAIKALLPSLASDEDIQKRFTQEAQIASGLEHANIIRILDLEEDGGQVFLAMEYIPAGDLQKRLTGSASLSQKEFLRIMSQVADALDYAHSIGIFHRDVKPSNILLDGDGNAHLTDFGMVRIAETSPLNPLGGVGGTAAYISPEQAEGKPIDGRADQYSLAVLVYEFFAGSLPFKGDSSTATALQHVTRQPAHPSSINAQLPDEVGDAIMRGLSKDPTQRYNNCREFIQVLAAKVEDSQLGHFRKMLAEARIYLENGQVGEAHATLENARKVLVDHPELATAFSELEAASQTAETYQQMLDDWQIANQKAAEVLEMYPDYPDPQGIFVELGLRNPGWSLPAPRELVIQVGLGLLVGLPIFAGIIFLAFRFMTR